MLNLLQAKKTDSCGKSKRNMFWQIVKLTGLAALISPANQSLCNFLLFHPDREATVDRKAIEAINQRYKTTWLDETFPAKDGTKLHGWYVKLPDAKRTFLVSHGNAGNLAYRLLLIASLIHCGGSVFVYDYRGYGKSEGEPTPDGIADDGLGAYDYLVDQKKVAPGDVIVYGESLGCAVSTQIAKQRTVAGVVLQSGFSTIVEAARDRLPWMHLYPEESFPQRFLENVTAYRSKHPPLLLLHGEKDSILPCKYSQEIFQSAIEPKQLVLLPNCAHNDVFTQDIEMSTSALREFLASTLISQTVAHNNLSEIDFDKSNELLEACTK